MCCCACNETGLHPGLEETWNVSTGVIKYLLRRGNEPDRPALRDLLASYGMEADLPPFEFTVAEIEGQIVGAARLAWEDRSAYVRPILVHSAWQGKNIGRALIKKVANNLPSLSVVARGEAAGFYCKLGFTVIPWDRVPERYRLECQDCPDWEACCPVPMILIRSS